MKKLAFTLLSFISMLHFAFSQTNTFPATGNAGIGTTTPGQLLTIQNNAATIRLQSTTSPTSYFTDFVNNYNATYPFYLNINGYGRFGAKYLGLVKPTDASATFISGYYGIAFATNTTDPTPADVKMAILSNGNVGIGTTTPTEALSLQKAVTGNTAMLSLNEAGNNGSNAMSVDWRFGGSASFPFGTSGVTARIANERQTTTANFDLAFYNTAATGGLTERMRILANGNVGIGTSNAQGYKLAVNGSMIATAVTVKLYANWPDYVFNKDYHLTSLNDVKSYIDQNHHLPDMPSEKEVAKDGINLGEMNRLLTKKVEELTLYLIDKDKKEKEQEERINKLEQQLRQLITSSHQ